MSGKHRFGVATVGISWSGDLAEQGGRDWFTAAVVRDALHWPDHDEDADATRAHARARAEASRVATGGSSASLSVLAATLEGLSRI